MQGTATSAIQQQVEAISPEIESMLTDVQDLLNEMVVKELRRSYLAAIQKEDSTAPLEELVTELETLTSSVQEGIAGVKTRLQELVQSEVRRAISVALENVTIGRPQASPQGQPAAEKLVAGVVAGQAASHHACNEPSVPVTENMYKGTVRLRVKTSGSVRAAVQFLAQLRRLTQLRLLRVAGTAFQGDIEVLVGVREPLDLGVALLAMENVHSVRVPPEVAKDAAERLIDVSLSKDCRVNP